MKGKVMRFFLVGLLALSLPSFLSCITAPTDKLTNQQVVAVILNSVPYIDYYLEQEGRPLTNSTSIRPFGDWEAFNEGDGNWRVQGKVVVSYPDGDKYCSTTWTFTEDGGVVRLIQFAYD